MPADQGEAIITSKFHQDRFYRSKRWALQLLVTAGLGVCAAGLAQESQPPPPDAPTPNQQEAQSHPSANPVTTGVDMFLTLQKKSLVFPDLAMDGRPLSPWDKLKLGANNTVSLSSLGAVVVGSAYGQAVDKPGGWGQGWGAYGQRLGGDIARVASYNFFGTFAIASVTHEDPRFYVKKDLNFGQSLEYSASRLVITRSDSGNEVVNYNGILGPLAAEGLASVYYPRGSKDFGSTMIRYSTDIGWRYAGYLLRQYWPEINRKLGTREESGVATPSKP
jgi:hypothetical protein